MERDEAYALIRALVLRDLVGHVIVEVDGEPVAVRVVEAGWLDEPRPGDVGDAIETVRIPGVPAYRVWRAVDAEESGSRNH